MAIDYLETARKLRAKAADPVVPDTERQALLERATDLEARYSKPKSPSTDDTTVTDSGFNIRWAPGTKPPTSRPFYPTTDYREVLRRLAKNQWMWNTQYYDRYGNPRRPQEDIVEEDYRYESTDYERNDDNAE